MAGLDPNVVDMLLDKLSSDDDFRERFVNDPAACLDELGADDSTDAACLEVTTLASREQIAETRAIMREHLILGTLGQTPITLGDTG